MSSRLMPPKVGSSSWQNLMISSGSSVSISMSNTSTSPKRLNRTPLPSMTGLPARAPMLPSPSTARAVGDHGHQVAPVGVKVGVGRILLDGLAGNGHSGRVGQRKIAGGQAGLGGHDLGLARPAFAVIIERVLIPECHDDRPFIGSPSGISSAGQVSDSGSGAEIVQELNPDNPTITEVSSWIKLLKVILTEDWKSCVDLRAGGPGRRGHRCSGHPQPRSCSGTPRRCSGRSFRNQLIMTGALFLGLLTGHSGPAHRATNPEANC